MPIKTVHYRKFDPVPNPWTKGTLQSLLIESLSVSTEQGDRFSENWQKRCFGVPSEDALQRFTYGISYSSEYIFGVLCLYRPDDWAPVLKRAISEAEHDHLSLDEVLREVEIAERRPVEGEDYIRGIAYWLVVGDHFFVVQHTSIQTKAFEEYFVSFFRAASTIGGADDFALQSVFNKSIVGGDLDDISAVEIGGVMNHGKSTDQPVKILETEEQKVKGRRYMFEKAKEILSAIFGPPDAAKILADFPSEAELVVDVRFGYKTKKRKLSRAVLSDIARAARNLPDGEVRAISKNGRQIGDDLRLSMQMPFKLIRQDGALLDLEDTRVQLLRVYQRFTEDGKIE